CPGWVVYRELLILVYLVLAMVVMPAACQTKAALPENPHPAANPQTDGPAATPTVDLQTIVNRLEQAQLENHEQLRAYSVTREYRLFGETTQKANSEV